MDLQVLDKPVEQEVKTELSSDNGSLSKIATQNENKEIGMFFIIRIFLPTRNLQNGMLKPFSFQNYSHSNLQYYAKKKMNSFSSDPPLTVFLNCYIFIVKFIV